MWKHISGVKKPEKDVSKRKIDKQYYKEYDSIKRERKYLIDWEKNRSWLHDTENGMKCKVCSEFGDKNAMFVMGCTSYKLDSIIKHEKSKFHQKCALTFEAKSKPKSESSAGKMVKTLNQNVIEKLNKMFRNCHAIVMKNRPLSDYIWLCDLDDMKGVSLGQTYRNQETAKVFINSIAEVEFQKVAGILSSNNYLCVIGDGSTDSAVTEQDMWYVRTSNAGKIENKFIGVKMKLIEIVF